MMHISSDEFEQMVHEAVDSIPDRFKSHLENVAFLTADDPTREQLEAGGVIHGRSLLLGLYSGIPLPKRGAGYNGVAPDVITIFRHPHEQVATSYADLKNTVHHTVWHEVAHYFGLGHGAISALEHPNGST